MTVPFDIDPYDTLGVSKDASPIAIKKAYKKLCLKHHPDKLQQHHHQQQDDDTFPKLQFAYSILSDASKRQRYDSTGSLEDGADESGFDWKEYFDNINDKITVEMIDEDRATYQGSDEERDDIITNFIYYEGDFLKLFEVIPHLEFTESEEQRVFTIIEDADTIDKEALKTWGKYKKSRKTKVKQMLKKLAKEAKEALELEKSIKNKDSGKDLALLIKSRQSGRLDNLISSLESKYGGKRGKKRDEIDDDEFERIQRGLKKKRSS
ncbi:DnaJ-domain-containing protein [Suhomyces tanzawaensis NRRL Y-17324]|uniref:DnaJ-domain-containing protein n=1 Tax=Suhomyces tanzawaensis NRRL Y-17324 TaxID=984487 RepID=A0A1E4SFI2_9ASCO|nr:DnaJ-domain-containing protein [Suhomyces tanzawaensis NRRL Y-17324]ODV78225.1 DnaJ-domain-containing protein [Suhomyces tanzawaensis NRRL Y-17324]